MKKIIKFIVSFYKLEQPELYALTIPSQDIRDEKLQFICTDIGHNWRACSKAYVWSTQSVRKGRNKAIAMSSTHSSMTCDVLHILGGLKRYRRQTAALIN